MTAGTYYISLPLAIESVQSICLLHIIIFVLFLSLLYSTHKMFCLVYFEFFTIISRWLVAISFALLHLYNPLIQTIQLHLICLLCSFDCPYLLHYHYFPTFCDFSVVVVAVFCKFYWNSVWLFHFIGDFFYDASFCQDCDYIEIYCVCIIIHSIALTFLRHSCA